jgi:hypothetical protein
MLHRTILCFLGAGLMAGAFFAAESWRFIAPKVEPPVE